MTSLRLFSRPRPPTLISLAPSSAPMTREAAGPSDFMDLRAGSLLRADGGFLIMYSLEALSEVGVWRALKRTLNHNRLEIQRSKCFIPSVAARRSPKRSISNVKVILIGDRSLYELLYEYEGRFPQDFQGAQPPAYSANKPSAHGHFFVKFDAAP